MKLMRWKVTLAVVWLSLLFNIERLDFDNGPMLNLASSFYVLAAVSAALFLLVPMSRRIAYITGGAIFIAYALLKVASPIPVFQGLHKYLTVTEMVAILITMYLTWLVNQSLQDFEHAVEAISLPKGRAGLLEYDQMQERIRAEMGRARRHQHSISVAAIELDPVTSEAALHRAVRDAQAALVKRYVQVQFGVFMTKHIRETDVIAHQDANGHFLLLAPETPGEQVEGMLSRLAIQVEESLGLRFHYNVADFPKNALTSEELMHKATEKLQRETTTPGDRRAQREPAVATSSADTLSS
jgi:GGDEF domain-containing protein